LGFAQSSLERKVVCMSIYIYLITLVSLMVFGDKVERLTDDYIQVIYEEHIDRDPDRTHLALYAFPIWTGALTFLSAASLVDALNDPDALYRIPMSAAMILSFLFFFKVTKYYNKISEAQEASLRKHLAG